MEQVFLVPVVASFFQFRCAKKCHYVRNESTIRFDVAGRVRLLGARLRLPHDVALPERSRRFFFQFDLRRWNF